MGKSLFIAEKPSVAQQFGEALGQRFTKKDGYMESDSSVVTWCVGHLVTMSYPDAYDEKYKRWDFATIPFIPTEFKYQVIDSVAKQFKIVSSLLNREDVSTIYVCTDSGREGEYIYRLVERQAGVKGKERKRVWIDSQTTEEILRGIREAKDLSEYDHLSDAAYLRAKEDYLMGINFSRALTLKYGYSIRNFLKQEKAVVSVGRVMTCVLGIVVNREREIREFVKTPFYRVVANATLGDKEFEFEWRAAKDSKYFESPLLYKENGFKKKEDAEALILSINPSSAKIISVSKKKETKNPPLLYNLAELQNECSRLFKISPEETLRIAQELYEKKLTTYPRTDARVLSSAVAKEIHKNLGGLKSYPVCGEYAAYIFDRGGYKNIAKSRYVNDKQITDHYAIIPTGQGLGALGSLSPTARNVYEIIVRRFLSIFYSPATYEKTSVVIGVDADGRQEQFFSSFKVLTKNGYLPLLKYSFAQKKTEEEDAKDKEKDVDCDADFMKVLDGLKKNTPVDFGGLTIKEGETTPPKRYNSGALILTMENAGQFIEDEELRAQIKGSGIGTSATRSGILEKLVKINYLNLNKKTQIYTPTQQGELVYEVVACSIKSLLDPTLTASWEKGLTMVANGEITGDEYMTKLSSFVERRTNYVKEVKNDPLIRSRFAYVASNYSKSKSTK